MSNSFSMCLCGGGGGFFFFLSFGGGGGGVFLSSCLSRSRSLSLWFCLLYLLIFSLMIYKSSCGHLHIPRFIFCTFLHKLYSSFIRFLLNGDISIFKSMFLDLLYLVYFSSCFYLCFFTMLS